MPEIYKNGRLYGTAKAFAGATTQANGSSGLVPAPAIADKDKVLKGDGTWGNAGTSLPSGGTQGQYLVKQSATEGDADWESPPTVDNAPTQNSDNLVKSGGVFSAISAVVVSLTQAQYDALSQAEKMNGTLYLVDDTSSS